jgi:hypothetical protein
VLAGRMTCSARLPHDSRLGRGRRAGARLGAAPARKARRATLGMPRPPCFSPCGPGEHPVRSQCSARQGPPRSRTRDILDVAVAPAHPCRLGAPARGRARAAAGGRFRNRQCHWARGSADRATGPRRFRDRLGPAPVVVCSNRRARPRCACRNGVGRSGGRRFGHDAHGVEAGWAPRVSDGVPEAGVWAASFAALVAARTVAAGASPTVDSPPAASSDPFSADTGRALRRSASWPIGYPCARHASAPIGAARPTIGPGANGGPAASRKPSASTRKHAVPSIW